MTSPAGPCIRLSGVRQNNLKNFTLDLPLGRLVVVTGLSGSGKSSLAFETLFAEGQRRYIETFSPYARQFFDRMDKPKVDRIDGIPPAIAIEQRNAVRSTRSTVGTMTEICEYMKVLWPYLSQLFCRQCAQPVKHDSPARVWDELRKSGVDGASDLLVTFNLPLSDRLSLADSLDLVSKQGYRRLWVNGEAVRIEDAGSLLGSEPLLHLTIVQDRIKLRPSNRARFVEACEHAYHFGKGKIRIRMARQEWSFSAGLHCAACDLDYREPSPALFSFNHPVGACPHCKGFGRIITIDYNLVMPDRSRTLTEGVVKPWLTGHGLQSQGDLLKTCRKRKVPLNVPFSKLPEECRDWIINGDPDHGIDEDHEWPKSWYGVKGYFRWLESKAYKMHVRVMLSRYRSYVPCPECDARRFQPESLQFQIETSRGRLTLADFYQFTINQALEFIDGRETKGSASDPVTLALEEVRSRLGYLSEVGLGYLSLDRATRTLSGGETERVNLTTCLGTRLVNTLFVLDEPSVGLHSRDTDRLVGVLENLRDNGNTVVVVEHEPSMMRAADQIVDLGPGHGESGGEIVFQGTYPEILSDRRSLTGMYLSGRKAIEIPARRSVGKGTPKLKVTGANQRNLRNLTVEIPLGRLVCLTGVSGSGKTTLAREALLPALEAHFQSVKGDDKDAPESSKDEDDEEVSQETGSASCGLKGHTGLRGVVLIDQSGLGKTPRSNPAVYTGAFKDLRTLFAQTDLARQRGLNASAFSFNSGQGQCERCRGAGFEKIEMQFLSDVFVKCADCDGRRYRSHILEIKLQASLPDSGKAAGSSRNEWSVADLLDATVDEVVQLMASFDHLAAGRRSEQSLKLLQEVGLGYLRLGQPINTLSGGESQRLKLVKHLAEFSREKEKGATLFLFDEPTTGLHYDDVRVLLKAFQRLVDGGHSLLVIEHNLEVIKCADWVVDLGPEAGEEGGEVVVVGTPEQVARCKRSHTGKALAKQKRDPSKHGKSKRVEVAS